MSCTINIEILLTAHDKALLKAISDYAEHAGEHCESDQAYYKMSGSAYRLIAVSHGVKLAALDDLNISCHKDYLYFKSDMASAQLPLDYIKSFV